MGILNGYWVNKCMHATGDSLGTIKNYCSIMAIFKSKFLRDSLIWIIARSLMWLCLFNTIGILVVELKVKILKSPMILKFSNIEMFFKADFTHLEEKKWMRFLQRCWLRTLACVIFLCCSIESILSFLTTLIYRMKTF